MFFLELRRLSAFILVAVSLLAATPAQASPRDCERYLTEAEILAKHIGDSPEDIQRLFANYVEQTRNWRAFLNGEPLVGFDRTSMHVHLLHQTAIKDLNENIWNMTGTEEYLETFHDLLHQYLKANPVLGAVLHNDYKNHFVASPLDPSGFDDLVLRPVINRLILHMQAKRPEFDWASWIPATIFHGVGNSPAEAYFQAGLARAKFNPNARALTYVEWQAQALARRERITQFAERTQTDWSTILAVLHKNIGRGPNLERTLERWLRLRGDVDGRVFNDLKYYYDDLQIGDFYPLPDPGLIPGTLEDFFANKSTGPFKGPRSTWTVERRAIFTMARDANFIVATDVQNLGGVARRYQDQWIARGARIEELPGVYAQSTAALEAFFSSVHQRLSLATGGMVHVYWSGDDAVWFLPALTAAKKDAVAAIFRQLAETGDVEDTIELKLHCSGLTGIDAAKPLTEGLADALMSARDSLFAGKHKKKK